MKHVFLPLFLGCTFTVLSLAAAGAQPTADKNSFYKGPSVFSTRPSDTVSRQTIARFGPVGMAVDLVQPAFQMQISSIEAGSPAEKTGKLKAGQIIERINGQKLADIDPRIQLTTLLAEAEATDGNLTFLVKDSPDAHVQKVVVTVPVLGAYSATWPLDCKKSEAIVRGFADYLSKMDWAGPCELNGPALLFLLSTGDETDLNLAKEWVKKTIVYYETNSAPFKNWRLGYGGIPLAEYYLRTGDKTILPVIQKYADQARDHHYLGGWAHGGTGLFPYMGGGHMNAAGNHVLAFILLAKECGVDVDEKTLQSSLRQFYRFAGKGLTPYGDGRPETGFVDNGRCGGTAIAMAAATSLMPEGESSLYASARDVAALKSFYTTPFMNHGHTGGGVGEVWRSFAMGLLSDKRPLQYRSFMDQRQWFYDLSRRYDGSFGILGGGRYDGRPGTTPEWGNTMALSYTVPRKVLQLTGAKNTPHCRSYTLPERPWGTEADDAFLSLEACKDKDGSVAQVEKEILEDENGHYVLAKLGKGDVTDTQLRYYAHHQDPAYRRAAAQRISGRIPQYMRMKKPSKQPFKSLLNELLDSDDPRVRHTGILAMEMNPVDLVNDETSKRLITIISNPDESLFVADVATRVLSNGKPDAIASVLDRLLVFLEHDEWWLRNAALTALMPIIADKRYYATVFPVLSRTIANNLRYNTLRPLSGLAGELKDADRKVQEAAADMLANAYVNFTYRNLTHEVPNLEGEKRLLDQIAQYLAACPGGLETLLDVSSKRFPDMPLQHRDQFLSPRHTIGPKVKAALKPIILNEIIPEHVGRNYNTLLDLSAAKSGGRFAGGRNDKMDQLVGLYKQAGTEGFDWHPFGPDLKQAEWWYHTFDPIPEEQVPWDGMITRFRKVTMPDGMKEWHTPDFDPEKAGWKRGKSAFGQYMGRIPKDKWTCQGPGCFCGTPINTLWDKEVLVFCGKVSLPKMKEGYRYRLRVNTGDHVGDGGGYEIFINGRKFTSAGRCPRRGEGGNPKGSFVTKSWIPQLSGKEFTIAVKSFIRYNKAYQHKPSTKEPQGRISIHFQEMKIPPYSYDMVTKTATLIPMKTAAWQAKQFDAIAENDDAEADAREGTVEDAMFKFNGTHTPNPALLGDWELVDMVQNLNHFNPSRKTDIKHRAPFKQLTIKGGGSTSIPTVLWTGSFLMNITTAEALDVTPKTIEQTDYLFVRAGGFRGATGTPIGYMPPLCVMKRQTK